MELIEEKDEKLERAKKRVEELKGFYANLMSYIVIIPCLAGLNYWTNQFQYIWFLWAAAGWGLGLLLHAAGIFWSIDLWGKRWEERKIKEFMQETEDRNQWK